VPTIADVREAMHRQPFRGFTVCLTDGKRYPIKHPDFIAVSESPRGRSVTIYFEGMAHLINILHVVRLEAPEEPGDTDETAAAAGSNGPDGSGG